MALHLPIGPLKTHSGLELVPRREPSTYQPISRRLSHCVIGAGEQALANSNICSLCVTLLIGQFGSAKSHL